jgi:hypothetical protein
MGHRKYIDLDHPYRFDANSFGGTIELGTEPTTYYGRPILDEIITLGSFKDSKTYNIQFGMIIFLDTILMLCI